MTPECSSLSVEDPGFFKDFKVLFHGAVGPLGLSPSCMPYEYSTSRKPARRGTGLRPGGRPS